MTIIVISSYRNLRHKNLFSDRLSLLSLSWGRKFFYKKWRATFLQQYLSERFLWSQCLASGWFQSEQQQKDCCSTRPKQQLCAVTTGLVTSTCNRMDSCWQQELNSETLLNFLAIRFLLTVKLIASCLSRWRF